MLIGRRQVPTVCGGGSRLRVCSTTIGSLLLGDRATIAAHGVDGTRRRRRSDHGDTSRRLRSYLLLLLLLLVVVLLLVLLKLLLLLFYHVVLIIVSGIDYGGATSAVLALSDLRLLLDHNPLPGLFLDLHVHATIDDAIVVDPLNYFVNVGPHDVVVIVLSQTIRLVRSTFLYRVDGVADAEQLRVGAQGWLVRRDDAGLDRFAGADEGGLIQVSDSELMSVQCLHLGNRERGGSVGVFVLRYDVLLSVGGGLFELLGLCLRNRYRYRARGVDRGLLLLGCLLCRCLLLLLVATSRASSVAIGSARVCLSVCIALALLDAFLLDTRFLKVP